jgi:hypothetical protein
VNKSLFSSPLRSLKASPISWFNFFHRFSSVYRPSSDLEKISFLANHFSCFLFSCFSKFFEFWVIPE